MRGVIFIFSLLGSCTVILGRLSEVPCQQEAPRCDGSALVLCTLGVEVRIDCHEDALCHPEAGGFCGGFCGDGILQASLGEECDGGNANEGDLCSDQCLNLPHICGDGLLTPPKEECDDGANNALEPDRCRPQIFGDPRFPGCTLPRCGDGITDTGEGCDDGNTNNGDGCADACQPEAGFSCSILFGCVRSCGDGVVEAGEECDDGNDVDLDGCNKNCTLSGCGDGIVDRLFNAEECDGGDVLAEALCTSSCELPGCGDGALDLLELCDDGNSTNGDACDNNCTFPACFNGQVDPGEFCLVGSVLPGGENIQPRGLIFNDINQDGALDLVQSNFNSDQVLLHLGDGAGGFQPPQNVFAGFALSQALSVGDFNGDGSLDLFVSASAEFSSPNASLVQGLPELLFAAPISLLDSRFFLASSNAVFAADFDADGDDELVCAPSGSPVIFSGGSSPFSSEVTLPGSVVADVVTSLDANQDGRLDVVALDSVDHSVQLWLRQANGLFAAPQVITLEPAGNSLASADLNQDGALDLLTVGLTAQGDSADLMVLLGNGDGSFQAPQHNDLLITSGTAKVTKLAVGDVDGDGSLDVAVAVISIVAGGDGGLRILFGNGAGSLQPPLRFQVLDSGFNGAEVVVGDLNNDGKDELLTGEGGAFLFEEVH